MSRSRKTVADLLAMKIRDLAMRAASLGSATGPSPHGASVAPR